MKKNNKKAPITKRARLSMTLIRNVRAEYLAGKSVTKLDPLERQAVTAEFMAMIEARVTTK